MVVVDYFLFAEDAILQFLITSFLALQLFLPGIADLDISFYDVIISKFCGISFEWKGYFDISEEGMVVIIDKILSQ